MKTTLIKIAITAAIVLAMIAYVKYLQAKNDNLAEQVAILAEINRNNATELARLRHMAEINEQTLTAWEADKKALAELKRGLNTKIQKELQTNENFSDWADKPVPDAVGWMLDY